MKQKRLDRRTKRAEKKLSKAEASGDPDYQQKMQKKFGYNYEAAIAAGLTPTSVGEHWYSREPETGLILKGKKHPTMPETKKAERALGYKIKRKGGHLYSKPKK